MDEQKILNIGKIKRIRRRSQHFFGGCYETSAIAKVPVREGWIVTEPCRA